MANSNPFAILNQDPDRLASPRESPSLSLGISWFESDDGVTALTPRVIGETQRAQTEKAARSALPQISQEEWVETRLAPLGAQIVQASQAFRQLVAEAGGHAEITRARASMIAVFDLPGDTLYPMTLAPQGGGLVSLCLAYLLSRPAFADEAVRQALYDQLAKTVGPLRTANLKGYPSFEATRLNDPLVRDGVRDFLIHLRAVAGTRITSVGDEGAGQPVL